MPLRPAISHLSAFLSALTLFLVSEACSPEICNCPLGGALIALPVTPASPITAASATEPCTIAWSAGSESAFVMRQSAGACEIQFQAEDGTTYAASVQFQSLGGCCPDTYRGTATAVQQVDAGTRE
jgi:hypothetical protein